MNFVYSKRAVKDLKSLPNIIQKRVLFSIDSIATNPLVGKKLRGPLSPYRSLRVGEYRIIYEITKQQKQVIIMTIVPRGRAYKD